MLAIFHSLQFGGEFERGAKKFCRAAELNLFLTLGAWVAPELHLSPIPPGGGPV